MPENNPFDSFDWNLTTWEGGRREQLQRWAQLTLEEIIRAREEMAELSECLAPVRRRIRDADAKP